MVDGAGLVDANRRGALGSDNFPTTWAADGPLYTSWGDGGGFGGSNDHGRVGLGVARIEGDGLNWNGINVWGHPDTTADATTFEGKSYGMLSVDGVLYMWVVPDVPDGGTERNHYEYSEMARSLDHGKSWEKASWRIPGAERVINPTFLNFGQDYQDARDTFIYSYLPGYPEGSPKWNLAGHVFYPGEVYLMRAPKDRIFESREDQEWFTGFDESGQPRWGKPEDKAPVFEDPSGAGWCVSASYNPYLQKVVFALEHDLEDAGNTSTAQMGVFVADHPWGPWQTVAYWTPDDRFGKTRPGGIYDWAPNVFYISFPTKWFIEDSFTMVFTGAGRGANNDSFNTLQGRFVRTE